MNMNIRIRITKAYSYYGVCTAIRIYTARSFCLVHNILLDKGGLVCFLDAYL